MLCTDQHYPESFPDLLPRLRFGSCPPAPAKTASIMDRKSVQFGSFSSGWARSRALASSRRGTMPYYHVNRNDQSTGDTEVHENGCGLQPHQENLLSIGLHTGCPRPVQGGDKHNHKSKG